MAERFVTTKGMELRAALLVPPAPEHGVLYGHLFEMYCLAKLAEGGSFPMRSLDEPGDFCMPSNGKFCETLLSHVATAICRPASGKPQAESQQSTQVQSTFREHWPVWAVPAVSQE